LLYIEDFQDGEAQGWAEIELRAADWDIVSDPENPGDIVVSRPSIYEGYASLQNRNFDNAVWRFKIMYSGASVANFSWHWHDTPYETEDGMVEWSAYRGWFHFPGLRITRDAAPLSSVLLRQIQYIEAGVWHQLEISTYEGTFEFWLDGEPLVTFDDPQPLPEGRLTIGVGLGETPDNTSIVYFDDMSVCELSAPFAPMPTPEPDTE